MAGKETAIAAGRALRHLSSETGCERETYEALSAFRDLYLSSPDLQRYLCSYDNNPAETASFIDKAFGKEVPSCLLNYLKTMAKRHLFPYFAYSTEEFFRLSSESLKIEEGYIYTARPLDGKTFKELEKALGERRGSEVRLKERNDPSLIGGFRVYVGDTLYDNSLLGRSERLRETLKEEKA